MGYGKKWRGRSLTMSGWGFVDEDLAILVHYTVYLV